MNGAANCTQGYRGYCINMFEEIAKKAGLKYDLYQTPGNSYGRLSEKGQWDGAVKELIEKVFAFSLDFRINLNINC